ncbi:MAG: hypothetical protein PHQ00_07690 [Phycisphaerae bacterium]|nr:hypothetical protein [Phycisphaerae bacterium]
MNFQTLDQMPQKKNLKIWAVLTEWQGISFNEKGNKVLACKVRDDNNVEHKVRLYEGKGTLPEANLTGQRMEFDLSWYSGSYQNKPYTGYSGFWTHGALPQAPQNAPQGQPQPRQATNSSKSDVGGGEERRKYRGMCLSYCKDLVVAGKMQLEGIYACADEMSAWIYGEKVQVPPPQSFTDFTEEHPVDKDDYKDPSEPAPF